MVAATIKSEDCDEILCLPCNKLKDHPLHFSFYEQLHLEELICSIRKTGLLEPVTVRPNDDDSYTILSGHYRIRAARRLKWKMVPCRMMRCDERLSSIIFCTSNLLTRELNAVEEAFIISRMISDENFTVAEIGSFWGRSKSWVSRRMGLLTRLDPGLTKDLGQGCLSPRMAQELMRLPRGNDQEKVLDIVRRRHLNKDETAQLVTWWLGADEAERNTAYGKDSDNNDDTSGHRVLSETVSKNLQKCTVILDKLILIAKNQKVVNLWPSEAYISFRNTSERLEELLSVQFASAGREGG